MSRKKNPKAPQLHMPPVMPDAPEYWLGKFAEIADGMPPIASSKKMKAADTAKMINGIRRVIIVVGQMRGHYSMNECVRRRHLNGGGQ